MPEDNIKKYILELEQQYRNYYQDGIATRWLKQKQIIPLLDQLPHQFQRTKVGNSIEGREISKIEWGTGPIQVALWSQMHGDESTATRALFDLFKFLQSNSALVDRLSSTLHLHIIPMLNPDGAEVYSRRNAIGIDMNRDALALSSPESIILQRLITTTKPEFGFNLHDQSRYYRIGETSKPATVTFLAPAFDQQKTLSNNRNRIMNMILSLKDMLEHFIPGQVGRYDDTFNYRAFGDNIQKWGTAVVLFEAGEMPGDHQREEVRKLTFLSIVHALSMVAEGLPARPAPDYFSIPENNPNMVDLLIKDVLLQGIKTDIAINYLNDKTIIHDIGDLSNYRGYMEVKSDKIMYHGNVEDLKLEKPIDLDSLRRQDGSKAIDE